MLTACFHPEAITSQKNQPAGGSSQTSGGSITSESSSTGFRPIPKKRTFLSRRSSSQLQSSNQQGLNAQVRPAGIVPAPRRRRQQGSSNSNQSDLKITDEKPQESVYIQEIDPTQTSTAADRNQESLCAASQVHPFSSLERDQRVASNTRDRSVKICHKYI